MIEITSKEEFEEEVLKAEETVLVDFYATWCGPCKMMTNVIQDVAIESDAKVVKVDIDKNPEIATKYGILSIPTFMVFKNGESVNYDVGVMPKENILKLLK